MKKLLLLLLLIPVLSWADCPPDERGGIGYVSYSDGRRIELPNNIKEYLKKRHCEIHRCSEINDQTSSCVCENLGGAIADAFTVETYSCRDGYRDIEGIIEHPLTFNFFSYNTGNDLGIKSPHYALFVAKEPKPKLDTTREKRKCVVNSDGSYTGQYDGSAVELIYKAGTMSCKFLDEDKVYTKIEAKTPTPTTSTTQPTTPKTSITDAKSQCTDIGFKAGTEKFGECVLELMQ